MPTIPQKQVLDLIGKSENILVLPSCPPDGDSLGSAIATYLLLKKLRKNITVICKDPVPEVLQFLPNVKIVGNKMVSSNDFVITVDLRGTELENVKHSVEDNKVNIIFTPKRGHLSEDNISFNKGKIDYDLIITVDCAELSQLGEVYENNIELFQQIPIINIDHHISNSHFGKLNCVDIMASSTTEILLPLFEEMEKETQKDLMDEDIATLLLTGIITDTGSFQNANTTPKSFAKSAQLIAHGARQQEIIQHIYKTKQLSQLKLWGRVLTKIQTDEKHRIVWSVVSQQDFKDTESAEEQTGDIIDELMTNAPGAEVVMLMKEKKDKSVSVSIRTTNPSIDATRIAENFGGGGHTQAAGFRMENKNLREAEHEIIDYVKKIQKERLGLLEESENTQPMINVEELMERAEKAQKATELMPTEEDLKKYSENPPVTKEEKEKKKSQKLKLKKPQTEEEKKTEDSLRTKYKFEV